MSIGQTILANLNRRLSQQIGHRVDLSVADYRAESGAIAHVLIAFDKRQGRPRRDEVVAYVNRHYEGRVAAHPDSIVAYDTPANRPGAVGVVVFKPEHRVSARVLTSDPGSYVGIDNGNPLRANRVMHTLSAEVWNVQRDETGEAITIVRQEGEDVNAILQARQRRQQTVNTVSAGINFGMINVEASGSLIEIGDTVTYFCDGQVKTGCVQECMINGGETFCRILNEDGSIDTVQRGFIQSVVSRNPVSEEMEREDMEEYYRQAYGSREYAGRLTASPRK